MQNLHEYNDKKQVLFNGDFVRENFAGTAHLLDQQAPATEPSATTDI